MKTKGGEKITFNIPELLSSMSYLGKIILSMCLLQNSFKQNVFSYLLDESLFKLAKKMCQEKFVDINIKHKVSDTDIN